MGYDVKAWNTYVISLAQSAFRRGTQPHKSITKSRQWAQPRSGWRVKETHSSHSRDSTSVTQHIFTFLTVVVFETNNFKIIVNACLYTLKNGRTKRTLFVMRKNSSLGHNIFPCSYKPTNKEHFSKGNTNTLPRALPKS
jgi:hypothetical protein